MTHWQSDLDSRVEHRRYKQIAQLTIDRDHSQSDQSIPAVSTLLDPAWMQPEKHNLGWCSLSLCDHPT
ncbi:hypothetical protein [Scytonema sp. PCC 10023]|uniref:hypothetical protein n=1 Tax=Scytonema sp. PCC 10023 TaxID=1680591 RepID=UPI0039C64D54